MTAISVTATPESWFTLSHDLDKLFRESTTGINYHTGLKLKEGSVSSEDIDGGGSDDDCDSDSSSDEDEADQLKRYDSKQKSVANSTTNKKRDDTTSS